MPASSNASAAGVDTARDYYDSEDADNFYATIWGGEDIHIGLYDTTGDIRTASRLTVDRIIPKMGDLNGRPVPDIGSGFGGSVTASMRLLSGDHSTERTSAASDTGLSPPSRVPAGFTPTKEIRSPCRS